MCNKEPKTQDIQIGRETQDSQSGNQDSKLMKWDPGPQTINFISI